MKNIPQKIYLQIGEDCCTDDFNVLSNRDISWCADKINENDIEYVLAGHVASCTHDGEVGEVIKELGEVIWTLEDEGRVKSGSWIYSALDKAIKLLSTPTQPNCDAMGHYGKDPTSNICPKCNRPFNLPIDKGSEGVEKVETFDVSSITEEEKIKFLNGLTCEVSKHYLSAFISFGLKTHIEQMIIEESTGQEYVLTFRTLSDHMKKRIFESEPPTTDTDKEAVEGWISVKDGYPTPLDGDKKGNVLGWDKFQCEVHKCPIEDIHKMKARFTHWRPLPQPPIQ